MANVSDHFKDTIQRKIHQEAETDPLFAENLKKPGKNIDDCINYILSQVQKIGAKGYTDDEIYNLAFHYYQEDELKKVDPVKCKVVVNHKPELSEQEIQELREQARKEVINAEKERMTNKQKPSKPEKSKNESQLNLL